MRLLCNIRFLTYLYPCRTYPNKKNNARGLFQGSLKKTFFAELFYIGNPFDLLNASLPFYPSYFLTIFPFGKILNFPYGPELSPVQSHSRRFFIDTLGFAHSLLCGLRFEKTIINRFLLAHPVDSFQKSKYPICQLRMLMLCNGSRLYLCYYKDNRLYFR